MSSPRFDARAQSSQVLVAFETLEHDGKVVAEHTDLEDVAQTVTSGEVDPDAAIPTADGKSAGTATLAGSPLTGDFLARVALAVLALVACACISCAYALHRRRKTLEASRPQRRPLQVVTKKARAGCTGLLDDRMR